MKKSWVIIAFVILAVIGVYLSNSSEKSKNVTSNTVETATKDSSNPNSDNKDLNQNDNVVSKDSITNNGLNGKPIDGKKNNVTPKKIINKPQSKPVVDSDDTIIGSFKEIELIHNNLKLNKKITKIEYANFLNRYCYTKDLSKVVAEKEWNKVISLSNFTEVKIVIKDDKQTTLKALDKGNGSKWFNVTMVKVEGRWLVSKIQ